MRNSLLPKPILSGERRMRWGEHRRHSEYTLLVPLHRLAQNGALCKAVASHFTLHASRFTLRPGFVLLSDVQQDERHGAAAAASLLRTSVALACPEPCDRERERDSKAHGCGLDFENEIRGLVRGATARRDVRESSTRKQARNTISLEIVRNCTCFES